MGKLVPNIDIVLNATYAKDAAEEILGKGGVLGLSYFNGPDRISVKDYRKAAELGMSPDHDSEDMQFLVFEIDEMGGYLFFYEAKSSGSYLKISFCPAWNLWEKDYLGNNGFDIPRYLEFLIKMTEGFEIIDLRVIHEAYEF